MLTKESFEYHAFGRMRFIGIDAWRTGEDWGDLWGRSAEFMPKLKELHEQFGADITESCSLIHSGAKEVGIEEHFLAGYFFRADTPVPEGYDYYDIETNWTGYACYISGSIAEEMEDAYVCTRDTILGDGFFVPYPKGYWHAEVYTNGRPHDGEYRFGYMFPVVGKE